jgi:hypothetical protein
LQKPVLFVFGQKNRSGAKCAKNRPEGKRPNNNKKLNKIEIED